MAVGQCGEVEVVGGVVGHAAAAHDRARALVAVRGERDDLSEGERVTGKGERERGLGRFGRKHVAPRVTPQPPSDFVAAAAVVGAVTTTPVVSLSRTTTASLKPSGGCGPTCRTGRGGTPTSSGRESTAGSSWGEG